MKTKNFAMQLHSLTENGMFEGYASVFNNIDLHGDMVEPGAFGCSLKKWISKKQYPKMLWQHDTTQPIGLWQDIAEDDYGLKVKGQLLLTIQQGREAYDLLSAGIIEGLSIGYQVVKAIRQGNYKLLQEIDLQEISLVTFAANPGAKILNHKLAFRSDVADCYSGLSLEQKLQQSLDKMQNLTTLIQRI